MSNTSRLGLSDSRERIIPTMPGSVVKIMQNFPKAYRILERGEGVQFISIKHSSGEFSFCRPMTRGTNASPLYLTWEILNCSAEPEIRNLGILLRENKLVKTVFRNCAPSLVWP